MKCQNLFAGKNKKKYFNMSSAENFTWSAKHYFIPKFLKWTFFSLTLEAVHLLSVDLTKCMLKANYMYLGNWIHFLDFLLFFTRETTFF